MAKKKRTNTSRTVNPGNKESRNNWFNALSLIVGIAALVVAWNANKIAQQGNQLAASESRSQVVVLSEKRIAQDLTGNVGNDGQLSDALLSCAQQIRLSNLGSASDSIVGYQTSIQYKQTTSILYDTGEARSLYDFLMISGQNPARTEFDVSDALRGVTRWVELALVNEEAVNTASALDKVKPIELPFIIPGFEALDIVVVIRYPVIAGQEFNLANEYGQIMFGQQSVNLESVDFAVDFVLASSNRVETSFMECGAVGR
ncbi:MAG: hypothetical protein KDE09_12620 [Anaerolineales bacterium]|nr:hypothetical protein [Anaerolineales bacterium]